MSVGGTGVTVGDTRVAVGPGVDVLVGGTRVAVGSGVGVTVGGTRVAVGSPAVVAMGSKGVGLGDPVSTKLGRGVTHCTTRKASRETMATNNIQSSNVLFSTVIFFWSLPVSDACWRYEATPTSVDVELKVGPICGRRS